MRGDVTRWQTGYIARPDAFAHVHVKLSTIIAGQLLHCEALSITAEVLTTVARYWRVTVAKCVTCDVFVTQAERATGIYGVLSISGGKEI